ncbi:MAG: FG-GAP-like repeat-containing protein, partial [Cyanobacteria bacterium J06592_8]
AIDNVGIAQLEVSIGAEFVPVSTNIAEDGTFTLTQDQLETAFNTELVDGAYTISVQAVDTSSLVSEVAALSFTLDTTPPTISAQLANDTGDDNSDGITTDPTITGTVSDANEIVALRAGSEGNLINISSQLAADGSFEVEQLQIEASLGESLVENTSYSLQLETEDRSGLVTQTTVSFTLEEIPDETNPIDEPPPPEEIEMIDDDDEIPPAIQPPEEREVIEEPGNEEAFEITVSSNPIIYSEQVSGEDLDDFYVFTVETPGNISLDLTGLSSDADLILFDSNANPIDFSNAIAITDESITRPLDAGTYFIVVTSFDQETTEYDLGVVFTSRVAPPPPELETDLVRYDFGYLYDGATLEDDFYLGYTYAEPGTFELNTFYDDFSGENEDGSNGLYFVFDDTGEVPSDAVLDEVYVLGYFDIDASNEDKNEEEGDPLDELYIPFYSANGLASGFEGLGSEYDFIALEDGSFDDFGFDFYEADGVEEIFSNTHFTRADYDANSQPGRMVNADLNSDGRDELIVTNTTSTGNQNSSFSILFNEGDGSFEAPVDILTDFPSEGDGDDPSIDVGDIDGDGNVDLIAVSPETNEISLYLGDGNGNLSAPGTVEVGDRPVVSATTDVDSDGSTDIVLINSEERDVPFYTGDSLSVLFNRTGNSNVTLTAGEGVRDVVAADLDGDGDVDLATANDVEGTVSVLINFGNIIFSDPIKYDVGDRPVSIIADDLDGDGTVDLATTDFGSDTVSVLQNSGDGFFAPALTFTTNENPSTMSAADLDGDGDSDLVMRNSVFDGSEGEGNSISLLLNNGDATFNEPFSFTVGEVPVGLIVEDLDGNGLLDIATSNFDGQSVTVYLQS